MGFNQPQAQQTQTTQLSPAQQAYQTSAANWLQSQVGQPAQPYPGQLTAGLSPQQAQLIGQQGALGMQAAGPQATGLNTLGQIAGGNFLYDPNIAAMLNAEANYAQTMFGQNMRDIASPFQQAGQYGFSTPMIDAMTRGAAQFQTGLSSNLAQQAQQAYQNALAQMQQAAVQSGTLSMAAGQQGLQALGMPQATQQAALSAQYQDWLRQLSNMWQAALGVPGLVGMPTGTTSMGGYGPSPFQQMFGGLTNLAGPFAMLRIAGIL